jgi:hypothetical protein
MQRDEPMYQRLGDVTLKNGETVEIGVITPPMSEFAERLKKLLGHKGWEWVWQVGLSVEGKTDDLENRFYVARRGPDPSGFISNVCTFEQKGVGILGHVWTPPEERRKGLCNAIFEKLMADFRARKGKLMLLGTGFDTPPYHIYQKFGFTGFYEGSGLMRFSEDPNFERKFFAKASTRIVEPTWSQWPLVNALFAECEEYVKSFAWGKFYKDHAEDCYIYLRHALVNDPRVSAKLLQSEKTGAIVGCAWVVTQKLFPKAMLLDLTCHPKHTDGYAKLLAAMSWPDIRVFAIVESKMHKKAAALKAAGFERAGTLRGTLPKHDGTKADVHFFARDPR